MDGYINEGGQLKTKNGQKYVVNNHPEGIFVSKACAILTCICMMALLLGFITVLICFLTVNNCTVVEVTNGTISSAGIFAASVSNGNTQLIENGNSNAVLADEGMKTPAGRDITLYEGWSPISYRLIIEPNIKTSTNNGSISINVTRDQDVEGMPPIVLDINNITINSIEARDLTVEDNPLVKVESGYGENNETYIIKVLSDLKSNKNVTLSIDLEFHSQLTDTLQGFYKTSYIDPMTGARKWAVSTQFSPIDARRAFPCFDRPDKKATFEISLVRELERSMAISNMPLIYQSFYRPGYVRNDFNITPKMSTYLVAFIVSELVKSNHSEEDEDQTLLPRIDIWTRPESAGMTKYPYRLTRNVLPFFERFFGIPFILPKIDLVAVPDFGFSAMENWGLITFRDSALLVPDAVDQTSSAAHRENVASIMSHELAHQWFGNLVTPKWWDELWLKEGFATYMSYVAVDNFEPDWKILNKFPIEEFKRAMEKDSDESSHPISFPVSTSVDIRRIFDPISYAKGAIVIRMMNGFLGKDAFSDAIKHYLREFSYQNTVQDDLWHFMTEYGHKHETLPKHVTVKDVMDTWTVQPGYPVVTVERKGTDIVVKQQRYMLPKTNEKDNSKWFIPISYETSETLTSGEKTETHWLTNKDKEIVIPNVFSTKNNSEYWIYLNINRTAYYRVNYDYPSWISLKKKFHELPPISRAQLLDDSLHLARNEFLGYDIPLTFIMELATYTNDTLLWAASAKGIEYLTHMMIREPAYETYRAYLSSVVRPAYDLYGLNEPDGESHNNLIHRARVVKYACFFNYDRCTNAAQLKYREWMIKPQLNLIKPNLKETIYCTALREGSSTEWHFAYQRYRETTSASEKEQILSALGCTLEPFLLSKYLNMTLDPTSGIRKQDGARAFTSVARNYIGYEIAFDFLMTNIQEISEYFGDGFSTLSKMVDSITTYMNKDHHKDQLDKFAAKARSLGLKPIESAIDLAYEQVKNNIFWRSRSYYNLKGFLESLAKALHIHLY